MNLQSGSLLRKCKENDGDLKSEAHTKICVFGDCSVSVYAQRTVQNGECFADVSKKTSFLAGSTPSKR